MHEPNPDEMLERMSSRHVTEWQMLFAIKAEEADNQDGRGEHGEILDPAMLLEESANEDEDEEG